MIKIFLFNMWWWVDEANKKIVLANVCNTMHLIKLPAYEFSELPEEALQNILLTLEECKEQSLTITKTQNNGDKFLFPAIILN